MTSRVVISAHCADDKQVMMVQSGSWNGEAREKITFIQNGKTKDLVFYDDMMISVREVKATYPR